MALTGADADGIIGQSVGVKNVGTVVVYIGAAGVTDATGFPVAVDDSVSMDLGQGETLYAYVPGTTNGSLALLRSGT